jgi:hypothetical protein
MKSQRKKLPILLLLNMVDAIEYECLLSANSSPLEKRTLYLAGDLAGVKDPNSNSGSYPATGVLKEVTMAN